MFRFSSKNPNTSVVTVGHPLTKNSGPAPGQVRKEPGQRCAGRRWTVWEFRSIIRSKEIV